MAKDKEKDKASAPVATASGNKLTPDQEAELKKLEEEEAAAQAAQAAAEAAAASPPAAKPDPEIQVVENAKDDEAFPPDAPNDREPVVPLLSEWLDAGYPEKGYYKRFGKNPTPNTDRAKAEAAARSPQPPKTTWVGDIPVVCQKTETHVHLGNRRYQFVQGAEIMMHPDHAEEMENSGWVKRIDVG